MSPPTDSNKIPLVVIGYGRKNAVEHMPEVYQNTPYLMTAALDLVETMEPYRLTPHNLGVVLHNLYPRPLGLVVGIAVDPSYLDGIKGAWQEYVDIVLRQELKDGDGWKRSAYVPLPLTHYVDPTVGKPPMNMGWEEEMFRQLDAAFQPEKSGK